MEAITVQNNLIVLNIHRKANSKTLYSVINKHIIYLTKSKVKWKNSLFNDEEKLYALKLNLVMLIVYLGIPHMLERIYFWWLIFFKILYFFLFEVAIDIVKYHWISWLLQLKFFCKNDKYFENTHQKYMKSIQHHAGSFRKLKNTSQYSVTHLENQSHPGLYCRTPDIFKNIFQWAFLGYS